MNFPIFNDANETPLERLLPDGGFSAIFRSVACVGDSLSSGEFEEKRDGQTFWHDRYDYSWGQFMARATGAKVYNFSRGGMTAKIYCETFAQEQGFWDQEKACQAYILALGVNDLMGDKQEIGSTEDICLSDYTKNKKTFAGYLGEIVQRLKDISPRAFFFFMTMPRSDDGDKKDGIRRAHAKLMYEFADYFSNSFVIDFYKYAPVYDADFREIYYLENHMNACGYYLTAKMTMTYIDYIIRHNVSAFRKVGMFAPRENP